MATGRDGNEASAVARVLAHLEALGKVLQTLHGDAGVIVRIADTAIDALQRGHKLIAFGNGGSAADAEHFAAELVGRYVADRPALPALALAMNGPAVTAIANDYGYDAVFARQIAALGQAGDVAVGITTSGKSENVLRGLETAKSMGLATVALTGGAGIARGDLDIELVVSSSFTPLIQGAHSAAIHCICELIEHRWLVDGAR